ncbi:hypothetical protein Tco_0102398, partial [Tanacetum coccineum]
MARLVLLDELAVAVKPTLVKDQMLVYFDRGALIEDLQNLKGSVDAIESATLLRGIQRRDVEKATSLLIMVKETKLWAHGKVLFLGKMR